MYSSVPSSDLKGQSVAESLPDSFIQRSDGSRSKVTIMGHGQIRVPNKGRWAHDNVKLLHFLDPGSGSCDPGLQEE